MDDSGSGGSVQVQPHPTHNNSRAALCRWQIPLFSKIKARQLWSPYFEVGGYDCRLLLYPKGGEGEGGRGGLPTPAAGLSSTERPSRPPSRPQATSKRCRGTCPSIYRCGWRQRPLGGGITPRTLWIDLESVITIDPSARAPGVQVSLPLPVPLIRRERLHLLIVVLGTATGPRCWPPPAPLAGHCWSRRMNLSPPPSLLACFSPPRTPASPLVLFLSPPLTPARAPLSSKSLARRSRTGRAPGAAIVTSAWHPPTPPGCPRAYVCVRVLC